MSNLFWDYQIISLAFIISLAIYLNFKSLIKNWSKNNRQKTNLKLILGAFLIIALILLIYGSLIEPHLIKTTNIKLNFNQTSTTEQLKIVQLSDLHAGGYKKTAYFEKVAQKIIDLNPDIIVLTGDYILGDENNVYYLKGLASATKIFPTYAVTGNHEYAIGTKQDFYNNKFIDKTTPLRKIFQELKIDLLENNGRLINHPKGQFYLAGLSEIWMQPNNLDQQLNTLFNKTSNQIPKILLSHNPEIILATQADEFNLILSGHTHGGQIRLPLIGSIASIPTQMGRKYDQGLFKLNTNSFLYVNRGIGEVGPRARLFCRPEITLFEINL